MWQYIKIEAKRLISTLPGFLAALLGTLLLAFVIVVLAGNFLPEALKITPFRVGLCVEGGGVTANYISEYVEQMDSINGLLEFREIPFQEIRGNRENQEIQRNQGIQENQKPQETREISGQKIQEIMGREELTACIVVPERTAESVMDGTNIPVQVFMGGNADNTERYLQQRLLTLLTEYGAALIDVPQAETLLLYEMQAENAEETGRVLDLFHFGLVLDRENWFEENKINAFGSVSAGEYYLAAGAALLFLFWGLGSGSFFREQEKNLPLLLKRRGISLCFQQGVKQTLYIALYLIPALLLSVGMRNIKMVVPVLICSVMLSLQCSFFFELAPSVASGVILNSIWGLAVFLGAGGMLPAVFLPEFLTKVCGRLPAGICLELLLQSMAGKRSAGGGVIEFGLLWCLVFGVLGQLVFCGKQRNKV